MIALLAMAGVVFVPMLFEAARARRNERALVARGGIEPAGDVYRSMRIAYPAAFLAMMTESAIRGAPSAALFAAGLVTFGFGKLVKWWAVSALGPRWTFRIIVVPGDPLVVSGPYRYTKHPNYVGVVVEFIGAMLMSGAIVAGPIAIAAFSVLLAKRIAVEEQALGAILAATPLSKNFAGLAPSDRTDVAD